MRLLMNILRKNEKLNIDNTTLDSLEIRQKLSEEFREVCEAMSNYEYDKTLSNLKEIIRETYDLIQMCILILWRCHRHALTLDEPELINNINKEHREKLSKREWISSNEIQIDIKE